MIAKPCAIGFIGAGRVAQGLTIAMTRAGYSIAAVNSRSRTSSDTLARYSDKCVVVDTAQAVADACDLVFITTPDDTIECVARSVRWDERSAVVHCSGATDVSALTHADAAGARTGGFHPMQSFTDPVAAATSLPGCTVTIEAEEPLDALLVSLTEALGCRVNRLPPGKRALYHASAGYGSQFINTLLAETAAIWRGWGASDEAVIRAILPMVRGTLDSIDSAGIAGGMPGPVSRGDIETIEQHVAALQEIGGDALSFYTAHCLRTVTLAEAAGRIDSETAARLRAALDS